MAAWRYKISLLLLKKYFTRSLLSLVKYFSPLEEKFRISAWPCNILYFCNSYKGTNGTPRYALCSSFSSAVAAGSA